jgi:arsenite methyltransferase
MGKVKWTFEYRGHHPPGEGGAVTTIGGQLDTGELEDRVKAMYREVAETPGQEFHFETGRPLAERLGYAPAALDRIPAEAIESFAGVGYFHDLAAIRPGEAVLDLGSSAGMDSFLSALVVGEEGRVIGVDMTEAQLAKARRLAGASGLAHASSERATSSARRSRTQPSTR